MGGYDDPPPWKFGGRALYQLQLVRSKEARKHVPSNLKLVEAFGYTLGGLYLARYDDSPAGVMDEMVVLAGLAWNPPTSCAWASRVYVNKWPAADHGIKTCGLPSKYAAFTQEAAEPSKRKKKGCWWAEKRREKNPGGIVTINSSFTDKKGANRQGAEHRLKVPGVPPAWQWRGPSIRMFMPSFSGHTAACPDLLKYSLDLRANIRLASRIKVVSSSGASSDNCDLQKLFVGKPLITMAFDNMQIKCGAPMAVRSKKEQELEEGTPWVAQRSVTFPVVGFI
mmetsp:Transcript_2815/g.5848  ORF Transcript_2815/g.5848 Transcript_2815/m.5848 type:complete len:281 (-) Transcript_2815:281-1123(-)|eukprot:CAMPEP_0118932756 /NCGR_PEP_ID=MMETSP1169-20130426/10604_1 /TAXON_ID=36882 /ORGANISM="Pyramimonas obovata, Strain CCMP722" /LENGTH=280 /DNA_ID=CAMNT_0006875455 /DNA_START=68 /DNA_END=910 /DNA_ORIENTATION=+